MGNQKETFLSEEGDNYFLRNQGKIDKNEYGLIIPFLKEFEIKPKKILEIGCSSGIKLNNFNAAFGAECYGIDPSAKAIEDGKREYPSFTLKVGTADELPFEDNSFDVIVFGFCLYLCDRKLLFKIAYEADRCLANNGFMVIQDFYPPFAYQNSYSHLPGISSFKMDHSKLFSWNPYYTEIGNKIYTHSGYDKIDIPDEKVAITILAKNEKYAYPFEPFKNLP